MPRPAHRSPTSPPSAADDLSNLTLSEIQSRLERNTRVLNTGLFSSPPLPSAPPDPIRDKLLSSGQGLLAREAELLAVKMEEVDMGNELLVEEDEGKEKGQGESSADARRRTWGLGINHVTVAGGRSGKMKALQRIQEDESRSIPGGMILCVVSFFLSSLRSFFLFADQPDRNVAETIKLGERDYQDATANSLAALSLAPPPITNNSKTKRRPLNPNIRDSASPQPRPHGQTYDTTDEIARAQATARMKAFINYKPSPGSDDDGDDDDFLNDEEEEQEWDREGEGEYNGDQDRLAFAGEPGGGRGGLGYKEKGTGEEVDEFGEDDERWAEGAGEYLERTG